MSIFKKGHNWYIDYYVHGRRKREKIGPSKKLTENILAKRKLAIAENRFLDIKKTNKVTFSELSNLYLELHSKPNKKSWRSSDENSIKRLKAFFHGMKLYEVTQELVEQYKVRRAKNVAPASVNRELACLKHMFNKAIEWGKVENNPAIKVKLYRESNSRLRYLEKEEIKKLIDNCNDTLRPVVILAIYTGMRQGEMLSLKWHDVDLRRGIIYVLNTKNSEAREIPMCNIVRQTFVDICKHPESPYVFCKKNGKPYGRLRKSFLQALKKSDILNFRFHDLRHTCASHLAMSGVDLNTIRDILGHKSLKMTQRYAHLSRDHKRRAMDIFGHQMDTIWTPEPKTAIFDKLDFLHNSFKNKELV